MATGASNPKKGISGVGLTALTLGALLLWAAVKGRNWSEAMRELVSGEKPSETQDHPITIPEASMESPGGGEMQESFPAGGTPAANQAIAKQLAVAYGWHMGAEWEALVELWRKESNWNNKAKNPSSGAYGIPQALPPTKMPKAAQESGGSSAEAQIRWGLNYIKNRYGSPMRALAFHRQHNWY